MFKPSITVVDIDPGVIVVNPKALDRIQKGRSVGKSVAVCGANPNVVLSTKHMADPESLIGKTFQPSGVFKKGDIRNKIHQYRKK